LQDDRADINTALMVVHADLASIYRKLLRRQSPRRRTRT
jgi:hypothetical protein